MWGVDLFPIIFTHYSSFLPETQGHSLEEMDVIFGAISREAREAVIEMQEREIKHEFYIA